MKWFEIVNWNKSGTKMGEFIGLVKVCPTVFIIVM